MLFENGGSCVEKCQSDRTLTFLKISVEQISIVIDVAVISPYSSLV